MAGEELKADMTEKERLQNAVIEFSAAMQGRLFEKADGGKTGWKDRSRGVDEYLLNSMANDAWDAEQIGVRAVTKDDDHGALLLDIANKAMILWWRNEHREELVRV